MSDKINKQDLDNYITGHYGEDQLRDGGPDDIEDDEAKCCCDSEWSICPVHSGALKEEIQEHEEDL